MNGLARTIGISTAMMALAMLAGCSNPKPLYVDGAYVRLNPNPDNPAAGYLTIHGGEQAVTLRAIETDAAIRLEMHESMNEGEWPHPRLVVIEFPSRAAAEDWYKSPDYQKVIPLRLGSTVGNLVIVDGPPQ